MGSPLRSVINANHRRCRGKYVPCKQCGAPSWRRPADEKIGKGLFCSRACFVNSRGGDPDPVKSFWMKVEKRGPDECWGWKAQKRWDGYGRFVHKLKPIWGHRFSYELHHGPITDGMHVLHSCDNPECTNPKHLSLGTHQQNMADAKAKMRHAHGERNKRNRLTSSEVIELRAAYTGAWGDITRLAKERGLNEALVRAVVRRISWKHL